MKQSIKSIINLPVKGLNVKKFWKGDSVETLLISLEAGHYMPEHKSAKKALLLVIKGEIAFSQNQETTVISQFEHMEIPECTNHSVKGITDARFLIIR